MKRPKRGWRDAVKVRVYRFEKGASGAFEYEGTIEAKRRVEVILQRAGDGASSALVPTPVECVRLLDTPGGVRGWRAGPWEHRAHRVLCALDEEAGYPCVFLPARAS